MIAVIGFLLTVSLGLFFYVLRCRWVLAYGVIELVIALDVIFLIPSADQLSFAARFFVVGLAHIQGCWSACRDLRYGARSRQHRQRLAAAMASGEIKGVGVNGTGWTSPGVTICPGTACARRIRSAAKAVEVSKAATRIKSCRTYLIQSLRLRQKEILNPNQHKRKDDTVSPY
jgi:hypothetical protein